MRCVMYSGGAIAVLALFAMPAAAELSPQWRTCLGNIDRDTQIRTCTALIQSEKESAQKALAYGLRGNAWKMKGDYDRAIADYTEAIRLDPKDAGSRAARGDAWQSKGRQDRAIADYTEAIRLDQKTAAA